MAASCWLDGSCADRGQSIRLEQLLAAVSLQDMGAQVVSARAVWELYRIW